jgi:hypothetical protein
MEAMENQPSNFESVGCGFESHRGRTNIVARRCFCLIQLHCACDGGLLIIPYKFRKRGQPQVGVFHGILEGADREILRSAFAHPSLRTPAGYPHIWGHKICTTHVLLLGTPKEAFTQ